MQAWKRLVTRNKHGDFSMCSRISRNNDCFVNKEKESKTGAVLKGKKLEVDLRNKRNIMVESRRKTIKNPANHKLVRPRGFFHLNLSLGKLQTKKEEFKPKNRVKMLMEK